MVGGGGVGAVGGLGGWVGGLVGGGGTLDSGLILDLGLILFFFVFGDEIIPHSEVVVAVVMGFSRTG